jgi:hypothetical protein
VFILGGLWVIFPDVFILGELAGILWAKTAPVAANSVEVFIPKAVSGANRTRKMRIYLAQEAQLRARMGEDGLRSGHVLF